MLKQNLSRFIGEPPKDLMNEESRIISAALDAAMENTLEDMEEAGDFQPNTLTAKILNHPRLVVGFAVGMVLASATYAALAWCWYTSETAKQPTNPMALAAVEDGGLAGGAAGLQEETGDLLKAADEVSAESSKLEEKADGLDKSVDIAKIKPQKEEAFAMLNLAGGKGGDPFSPLVQPMETSSATTGLPGEAPPQKDILEDVQYTGYIGDINSKDKVALIKVAGSGTVVKKIGESFTVEGERVTLKGISKNKLDLRVNGIARNLQLNPYVEVSNVGAGSVSSTPSASSSSGSASAASDSGSASGGTSSKSNAANPTLQEL